MIPMPQSDEQIREYTESCGWNDIAHGILTWKDGHSEKWASALEWALEMQEIAEKEKKTANLPGRRYFDGCIACVGRYQRTGRIARWNEGKDTLAVWCRDSGISPTHPTTEKAAVSVICPVEHPFRAAAFQLEDYVVSTVSGPVLWLVPRTQPKG